MVLNGTNLSGSLIKVRGTLIDPGCDDQGAGLATNYGGNGESIDCGGPNQGMPPTDCKTYTGLRPGLWLHEVTGRNSTLNKPLPPDQTSTVQHQFFASRVVAGSSSTPNRIYWTIPRWLAQVGNNNNTGTASLKQAILDANSVLVTPTGTPDTEPYLIQLKDTLTGVVIANADTLQELSRNRVTVDMTDNQGNLGLTLDFAGQCRNWSIASSHNNIVRIGLRNIGGTTCAQPLLRVNGGDDNVFDGVQLTSTRTNDAGGHRLHFLNGAGDTLSYRTPGGAQVVNNAANYVTGSELSGGPSGTYLGGRGVAIDGGSNAVLEYNLIHNNKDGGVGLDGAATAQLQYNRIYTNRGAAAADGVRVAFAGAANAGKLVATRNLIEDHSGGGMLVQCRADLTVDGSIANDNDADGLKLNNRANLGCPSGITTGPTAVVKGSGFSNNGKDGATAEGKMTSGVGANKISFGETGAPASSPGGNAFTRNNLLAGAFRNVANRSGTDTNGAPAVQLNAVNNQWEHGGTAASCTGSCLCGGASPNVCAAGCTAPICAQDIYNDPGASTLFGPPMMYRAGAPAAVQVYPSVPQSIGSLQWIIGANFNSVEGQAAGGNNCSSGTGNCVELWLNASGPTGALTPLADAPGILVVGAPIKCSQPTTYHINKRDSAGVEYPNDAVVTWCQNP